MYTCIIENINNIEKNRTEAITKEHVKDNAFCNQLTSVGDYDLDSVT